MRVALDAMGGDVGPIVAGAAQAVKDDRQLRVVLVGDRPQIEQALADCAGQHSRLSLFHASQTISADEPPEQGLRVKPDASTVRCWQLWMERSVEALVTTGSAVAAAAAGTRQRRFLAPVRAPGLAVVLPTLQGSTLLIDVAANPTPTPAHLYQYGAMGAVYAQHVRQIERPRIGLLCVGAEAAARHEHLRQTSKLYNHSPLREQFVGSVDPQVVHRGQADVLVADALLGQTLLKVWIGMLDFAGSLAPGRQGGEGGLPQQLSVGEALVGPFLGMDGVCFHCHGRPSPATIQKTLGLASQCLTLGLGALLVKQLEEGPLLNGG